MITINKDTKMYGSLSERAGSLGCKFFNTAFEKHNINSIYKSFSVNNISKALISAKILKFSGFAVSMPFKVEILDHVDEIDPAVKAIGAANTIVNDNGVLKAYNTDWMGVYNYLLPNKPNKLFILGNGGFSKAVEYACNQLDIPYEVVTRKDWDKVPNLEGTIFNATPVDVEVKGTLIDGRPFTESGKQIAALQAEEQYKIYTNGN